ncbi:MAG: RNA polymerase sigma factor region1.1 domain-containing protein [Candidatus Binataceae bacterium]
MPTNDSQRKSALTSLIAHGKSQGYLLRAAATAMLPVELFPEDQRNDIFEMIGDMGIPVVDQRPTEAELAAMQAPPVRAAPKSVVSPPNVGQPIGPLIVVLRVGAEGGGITLIAHELTTGWRYRYTMLDQTDLWLDEGGLEIRRQSEWVYDWTDALAALDTYPWANLRPLIVHPQFANRVLEAARERLTEDISARARGRLSDWSALCRC